MIKVTDHARDRITERIGCSERKIGRLAEKAYRSSEKVSNAEITNTYGNEPAGYVFRKLMGMIYVFYTREETRLITVYPPANSIMRNRQKTINASKKYASGK